MIPFLFIAVLGALPCEYVIDFGSEAVPFDYKMQFTFEARDGTRTADFIIDFTADSDPKGNRDFLEYALKDNNWATRSGPGNSVVVTGRLNGAKSPIKSVTLKSEKMIPIQVRWVPLSPEKKKK